MGVSICISINKNVYGPISLYPSGLDTILISLLHCQRKGVVGVKAFNRIASAIPGAADRVTAQFLFEALTTEDGQGLTFEVWDTYIKELCK